MTEIQEELAQALHEAYVRERLAAGEEPGSTPSLVPWAELGEEFRESSRRNANDIHAGAATLGYEVRPVEPNEVSEALLEEEIERLAEQMHAHWVSERQADGWRHGAERDDVERIHPDLVPWNTLPEARREIDRLMLRGLPDVLRGLDLVLTRAPAR